MKATRVAVYDRYWASQGGGERHAGMLAAVLAADGGDVELLGHAPVDLGRLSEHLAIDLSGCHYRQLPDRGDDALAVVSAEYDLFVNASYMSRLVPRAPKAVYLCFFPTPPDHDLARWRRWAVRILGPALRGITPSVSYGSGWYPPEGGRRRTWVWSNGDATLSVAPGRARELRVDLGRPGAPGATPVQIAREPGEQLAELVAAPAFSGCRVALPASTGGFELRLRSETFTPGPDDPRTLGVAVSRARVADAREGPRERAALRFPWLLRDPRDVRFLEGYDVVLANSRYTRGWISRLWRRSSDVLYPPVAVTRVRRSPWRAPVVLGLGRFFAPGSGHSKRQLEMVRWWGELAAEPELQGWTLHLVGGCEPRQEPYLAQVRAAAAGLPVEIEANVTRARVEELLGSATVFWSATGFGEDERRTPWASEHFGLTTVEAMAGGCVPVVIDRAGQAEIVREGVDGYRWSAPEELIRRTREVAADDQLRARLSEAAVKRAQQFSDEAFAAGWRRLAAERGLLG